VRLPLTFMRSGVKVACLLPPKVLIRLQEEVIDPRGRIVWMLA
jgi:hypothetical protein